MTNCRFYVSLERIWLYSPVWLLCCSAVVFLTLLNVEPRYDRLSAFVWRWGYRTRLTTRDPGE